MLNHRFTTVICVTIVILALLTTCGLMYINRGSGTESAGVAMGYENRLFDDTAVHTIDIVMEESDWTEFLNNAQSKEYVACDLIIDNEAYRNVAIRAKGNSSMSMVAGTEDLRYSFKVEFDHYTSGQTYHGLDKLALNNLIQDNTCLKDYFSYKMMQAAGAYAPLCSFVQISVNGEPWGLYLAVEGIEEAFAERNFGSQYGQIYKPDSMQMGGGREEGGAPPEMPEDMQNGEMRAPGRDRAQQRAAAQQGQGGQPAAASAAPQQENRKAAQPPDTADGAAEELPQLGRGGGMGGPGGGSSDVALVYTDDDYDSYSNIFDNAVFDISDADKDRLIRSIQALNTGENLEEAVNLDEVIRYFVAHNFVVSYDSYTGSMMHNYYLYEKDGVLSMIAWDYNLAFGGFSSGGMGGPGGSQSGTGVDTATSAVNDPIDTPVSGTTLEDRPMLGKWLKQEEYKELYHTYFAEFLETYIDSGYFEQELDRIYTLIRPYVEADPTAFCTVEEFDKAVETLRQFVLLRAESVRGQLDGTIPSTAEGQAADASALVDASTITLSDMGSQGMGGGGRMGGFRPDENAAAGADMQTQQDIQGAAEAAAEPPAGAAPPPEGGQTEDSAAAAAGAEPPEGGQPQQAAQGGPTPGGGWAAAGMGGNRPGRADTAQQTAAQNQQALWIGGCNAVMVLAICFVLFFRRRKQ